MNYLICRSSLLPRRGFVSKYNGNYKQYLIDKGLNPADITEEIYLFITQIAPNIRIDHAQMNVIGKFEKTMVAFDIK